jgi:hypothetical protein
MEEHQCIVFPNKVDLWREVSDLDYWRTKQLPSNKYELESLDEDTTIVSKDKTKKVPRLKQISSLIKKFKRRKKKKNRSCSEVSTDSSSGIGSSGVVETEIQSDILPNEFLHDLPWKAIDEIEKCVPWSRIEEFEAQMPCKAIDELENQMGGCAFLFDDSIGMDESFEEADVETILFLDNDDESDIEKIVAIEHWYHDDLEEGTFASLDQTFEEEFLDQTFEEELLGTASVTTQEAKTTKAEPTSAGEVLLYFQAEKICVEASDEKEVKPAAFTKGPQRVIKQLFMRRNKASTVPQVPTPSDTFTVPETPSDTLAPTLIETPEPKGVAVLHNYEALWSALMAVATVMECHPAVAGNHGLLIVMKEFIFTGLKLRVLVSRKLRHSMKGAKSSIAKSLGRADANVKACMSTFAKKVSKARRWKKAKKKFRFLHDSDGEGVI